MCDEFVCSDSGVVSLCEADRKLLASLGEKRKIGEEKVDNNNLASETNRNLTLATKTDDQGIEADKHRTRLILTPSGADTFLSLS